MQRNPHSYQIATGYRTFNSLSLIYQPITKKRLFFAKTIVYYTSIHDLMNISYKLQRNISIINDFPFFLRNMVYTSSKHSTTKDKKTYSHK